MTIAPNTTNFRQSLGRMGEQLACDSLLNQGWAVLERNYNVHRRGEIDIIARPPDSATLAFVEVKTRDIKPWQTNTGLTHSGQMAVTPLKQRRMLRAAMGYLGQNPAGGSVLRFDLVLVEINLSRHNLNQVLVLHDLATLKRYATLVHLTGVAGTF